jgi:anti-sigma factor RsiW
MTDAHETHAGDDALSAYLDAELASAERRRVADHLAACPRCAARLADFAALSADFARLPRESLGCDLAGVVAGRLAAAAPPRQRTPAPGWRGLLPLGLGAAASVALGIAMGAVLFGGGGAALPRVTAMSVFDAIPPGGLCLGLDACYARNIDKSGAIK